MAPDTYETDRFYTEAQRFQTSDMVGGWNNQGDTFQLKYTLPGFNAEEGTNRFDLQTAIAVYQTGIHEDLAHLIVPRAKIIGVGAARDPARKKHTDLIEQGADVLGGQLGVGAVSRAFITVRNAVRGVVNSSRSGIDLDVDDESLGHVDMRTLVLPGTKNLGRNGFPAEQFSTYFQMGHREHPTGVILIKLQAVCTQEQVRAIMEKASNGIDPRYGVPRMVLRVDLPETEFENVGNRPWAAMYTASRQMAWQNGAERRAALRNTGYQTTSEDIRMDRVRYLRGVDLEPGYRRAVEKNAESLGQTFQKDPELQMQHLAHRLFQIYTRSVRRMKGVCRKRGFEECIGEITNFFTAAFNQFRMEKDQEGSIGSEFIPLPSFPTVAPRRGGRACEFMNMQGGGSEILELMMVDLEATLAICRDPEDYTLARSEQAGRTLEGTSRALLRETDLQAADDPDLLRKVAGAEIERIRGVMKGKRTMERKRIRKERKQF